MKKPLARILVIDDDLIMQEVLECYLKPKGYSLDYYSEPFEPLKRLTQTPDAYDLVLTDLKMPEMDGLEFVSRSSKIAPNVAVLLMTAYGSIETAVKAIQCGARDFVLKPLDFKRLSESIERGLQIDPGACESGIEFVSESKAIREVFDLAKRIASSAATVLITGESGTGKEVVARTIHSQGERRDQPFVAINCSAIPENLLESELFGHAKGSFTGAVGNRIGLFEEAEGGTLFLDEIGDLNLGLQCKLLRVLQERRIKRLGENVYRPISARVIAATHKNLEAEIQKNTFREDLYYRLCVIPIHVPPLRERVEDIIPLAKYFLKKIRDRDHLITQEFSREVLDQFIGMPWRGNVRELENTIERIAVLCRNPIIKVSDLPKCTNRPDRPDLVISQVPLVSALRNGRLPDLEEFSQLYLEYVLDTVEGSKNRAAKILGIDRKTLYRKCRSPIDTKTFRTD